MSGSGATIARERETSEILELIGIGARWVTIWGPAGVGKSTVAQDVLRRAWARGLRAKVVDCSEATADEALCARVGSALDVPPGAMPCAVRAAASLAAAGPMLLVLDGWDRPDASSVELVHRWLDVVPDLVVVTTARHRAGSPREVVVEVEPLDEEDALRLFHARVRALRRDGTDVADSFARELVRRVDRIPFGIELVASVLARGGLERFRQDALLDVPAVRLRGAHAERSTLRHALEITWSSLGETTASLLAALTVFAGEFSLEDVKRVVGREPVVPDVLELCESALLRVCAPDRFSMLSTVRAWARERLAHDRDVEQSARDRHADLFVGRAIDAPVGPRDAGDVVEALRWRARRGAPAPAEAVLHLEEELDRTGRLRDLDELLSVVLDGAGGARETAAVACAWRARGRLRRMQGRLQEARSDLERASSMGVALGAARTAARANLELALIHSGAGELEAADRWLERATEDAARSDDRGCQLEVLIHLATLESLRGRWGRARELRSDALALARRIGDRWKLGTALAGMAVELLAQGDLDGFEEHAGQARELLAAASDIRAVATLDLNLGVALAHRGRAELAAERLDAARKAMRAIGLVVNEASAELNLGALEQERFHDPARGVERFETAARLSRDAGAASLEAIARARLAVALASRGAIALARTERDAARVLGERAEGYLARAIAVLLVAADVALADVSASDPLSEASTAVRPHASDGLVEAASRRLLRLVVETPRPVGAEDPSTLPERTLVVSSDGLWFRAWPGDWRDLRKRGALQRVLAGLVDAALESRGLPVPLETLVERGWPGERIVPRAAAARVHVAISTLRKLGLDACLVRAPGGYLLATDWAIRVVEPPVSTDGGA